MWTRPARRMTRIVWVTSLLGALAGCGGDLYLIFQHFELRGEQRIVQGAGCVSVLQRNSLLGASSSSGLGSGEGDLMVEEGEQDDRYVVVVRSFGEELAHRSYDRAFLRSRKLDRFEVTTKLGKRFEFFYQGSSRCVQPPDLGEEADEEPDEEALDEPSATPRD